MLNLKKTAIAVLALSSSAAFAGSMGPVCTAVNVTVPCERTAWDFGVQALYLQPVYNAGAFDDFSDNFNSGRHRNTKWRWGFQLEGSYHFGTGNDVDLNWYHLGRKSTNARFDGAYVNFAFPLVSSAFHERLAIKPQWDAVNLEFGQHVDFGEFTKVRFHGGAQYARIETNLGRARTANNVINPATGALVAATAGTPFYFNHGVSHRYSGFGPRAGADMSYNWGNGLSMYANGATTILAGTSKFRAAFATNDPFIVAPFNPLAVSHSRTTIVPEIEAKLGLAYTYAMAQGDLTLDVGYMWVNYFQVQNVGNSGFVTTDNSNFGLQGLNFGLKWVGNVV
jgi:hypothetical protein